MSNPFHNHLPIPYQQPLFPVSFPTYSLYPVYQPPFNIPLDLLLLPSDCALEIPPAMMHPLYSHPTSYHLVFQISHPLILTSPISPSSYAITATELNKLVQTEFTAVANDDDDRINWEQCYTAVRKLGRHISYKNHAIRVPPDVSVRYAFEAVDTQDTRTINFAQFLQVLYKLGAYVRMLPTPDHSTLYHENVENGKGTAAATFNPATERDSNIDSGHAIEHNTAPTTSIDLPKENLLCLDDLPPLDDGLLPHAASLEDVNQEVQAVNLEQMQMAIAIPK